jgi:hypothetical protein
MGRTPSRPRSPLKESSTHVNLSLSLTLPTWLQQIKDCRKYYGLREVVLSGIGGKSKPLKEAGVLYVDAGKGKVKKILHCATNSTNM